MDNQRGRRGVEEVTSDLLNPLADRLLKLDNGTGPIWSIDDLAQWGYDFLLGTAMGILGGGTQLARGVRQGQAQTAEDTYYRDLRRNGLGSAAAAENARRASDAMGRIMPERDGLRVPQLTTYAQRLADTENAEKDSIRDRLRQMDAMNDAAAIEAVERRFQQGKEMPEALKNWGCPEQTLSCAVFAYFWA